MFSPGYQLIFHLLSVATNISLLIIAVIGSHLCMKFRDRPDIISKRLYLTYKIAGSIILVWMGAVVALIIGVLIIGS